MRMLFSVLGLLVVLAVVGMLVSRQLQAVRASSAALPVLGTTAASGAASQPMPAAARKLADDVNQLMQQAPARVDSAY